ncbi:MAG: CDP-diacylglycerol--glycerol-3-phosphate 3-phosphatidyltransferase [Lachnospiraceae bacterium]|nr:CDP-diacylglycerol--glycerol-3-phosphate 3-phosphatidyltransferase [Lachnospiraceae bacterium]
MNLPNKLTIFRIILIPFFVFFMLFEPENLIYRIIAEVIFCVASLTDLLDGKIARKENLVTNFGKFMDPLADKLLVCSALICLVANDQIDAWIVIVIIAREFIISGLRLIASDSGIVIAASMWGKIKTTFQMIMIILLILNLSYFFAGTILGTIIVYLEIILIYVALVLTIISMIDYLIKNKAILKENI